MAREFDAFARSHSLEVLVPPSTLVEVVNLPVVEARQRIIHALAKGPRRRLRTEAESECAEVVAEIRRLRPHWLRRMPDTAKVASLNNFWTNRIWRSAVENSDQLHEFQRRNSAVPEHVFATQKKQRALIVQDRPDLHPLTALLATANPDTPESYLRGWSGAPVEFWRITSRDVFWYELVEVVGRALLSGQDTTTADWVGAYVDLAKVRTDPADFTRFWLDEVDLSAVPRQWIRWAVPLVQADRKVTKGNPADAQHSSYLVEADLFLSADGPYVSVLDTVRADAPFTMTEARLVDGDRSVPILDRLAAVV